MRLAALALLAGCGRIGFDVAGSGDGGGVVGDGGSQITDGTPAGPATFVFASGDNVLATNPAVTIPGQQAGDLLVVAIGWTGSVASVMIQDLAGDTFTQAFQQVSANNLHFSMFYALHAIAAPSNTIAGLIGVQPTEASLVVAQYRGISSNEGVAQMTGTGTNNAFLFALGTISPNDLVVVANMAGATGGTIAGFTLRSNLPGSAIASALIEDATYPQPKSSSVSRPLASATSWAIGGLTFTP